MPRKLYAIASSPLEGVVQQKGFLGRRVSAYLEFALIEAPFKAASRFTNVPA
jgi:hypothetical protein